MRIVIGSDHAGLSLKEEIKTFLKDQGYDVIDIGTNGNEPVDYPDYAERVGIAILEKRAERGILICGSGVGASVAANKIPGIRAAVCHETYTARQGVEHDALNVIVVGSRVIGSESVKDVVRSFLSARFSGLERYVRRLEKVQALERRYGNRESHEGG